ncbi:MAG TPA: cation:dicarboxylase symporter family transporter, partial [Gemmatimonadaceae bacterium]|nr:cation:dicarboxylase symporter family transporter [Gemmatimonadaceae bacterium]
MSLSSRVLLALLLGLAVGVLLTFAPPGTRVGAIAFVEPIGSLFVNGIRMTVIPLVVSNLIVGIATSKSGAVVARVGGRGVVIFVALLAASGLVAAFVAPPVLSHVTLSPAAVASVRAAASPANATQANA